MARSGKCYLKNLKSPPPQMLVPGVSPLETSGQALTLLQTEETGSKWSEEHVANRGQNPRTDSFLGKR